MDHVSPREAVDFTFDLTCDEIRRRRAVLEALGDRWDPLQVMAEEDNAHRLLYADLDDDQLRIFDELVRARVLPDRNEP